MDQSRGGDGTVLVEGAGWEDGGWSRKEEGGGVKGYEGRTERVWVSSPTAFKDGDGALLVAAQSTNRLTNQPCA